MNPEDDRRESNPEPEKPHPPFAKRREAVLSWVLAFFLGTVSWLLIQDAIRVEKAARESAGKKAFSAKTEPSERWAIRISNVPILVLGTGEVGWRVDPSVGVVMIEGAPEEMSQLDTRGIRLFVDVSVLSKPGRYEAPVRIHLPGFPSVTARVEPSRVFLEPLRDILPAEEMAR